MCVGCKLVQFVVYCVLYCVLFVMMSTNIEKNSVSLFNSVLYFSVRSSRSSVLRFGLPSCQVSKLLRGQEAVWEEARKIFFSPTSPWSYNPRRPPPRYILKSRWPSLTVRHAISQRSREKIGDVTVNSLFQRREMFKQLMPACRSRALEIPFPK